MDTHINKLMEQIFDAKEGLTSQQYLDIYNTIRDIKVKSEEELVDNGYMEKILKELNDFRDEKKRLDDLETEKENERVRKFRERREEWELVYEPPAHRIRHREFDTIIFELECIQNDEETNGAYSDVEHGVIKALWFELIATEAFTYPTKFNLNRIVDLYHHDTEKIKDIIELYCGDWGCEEFQDWVIHEVCEFDGTIGLLKHVVRNVDETQLVQSPE